MALSIEVLIRVAVTLNSFFSVPTAPLQPILPIHSFDSEFCLFHSSSTDSKSHSQRQLFHSGKGGLLDALAESDELYQRLLGLKQKYAQAEQELGVRLKLI